MRMGVCESVREKALAVAGRGIGDVDTPCVCVGCNRAGPCRERARALHEPSRRRMRH